ncbi:MAG TPA: hypothetical protein VHN77_10835 [Phycisphaerales bacterium]|nr:hypothetical protein [Phycisphaerales bacterium]
MRKRKDRAFSVIELAVVLAMAAVVCALLLPAMKQVRSYDRRTTCMQNLRVLGQGAALYETQYFNRIPTFSWRADIPMNPAAGSPVSGSDAFDDAIAAGMQPGI